MIKILDGVPMSGSGVTIISAEKWLFWGADFTANTNFLLKSINALLAENEFRLRRADMSLNQNPTC